ncbi:sensor histidine kinase [Amycolatopsis anabasis]|uniref:sensor histidine kinase n=1 Tax=Amycolatopsis anabasis TaxID=1840409 RepID=UPI00131E49F1|nr:HAMP domain-containing sensor histidine kinase [Amycolatopsis anabasis]
MRRSAADRLRRLRLLLTGMFTAINAAGLVVFAGLAVANNSDRTWSELDGELSRVTAVASRLVQLDQGTLVTGYLPSDPASNECPQFAVLPAGAGSFAPYYSARTCVQVPAETLGGLAAKAAETGFSQHGTVQLTNDREVRVRADPIRNSTGQHIGAIVAVADTASARAAHVRFVWLVVGGCVLLIGALALVGHVLSTRAIRPAAAALEQQEVLLAETAHDLRTPVASLRAVAETAMRHPDTQAEFVPRAVQLAAQMGDIIESLLVRARLAAGVDQLAVQPVWLDQLVGVLVDDTDTTGASVTVTAAPTLVRADPQLVRRAIANLLDNALRYGRQPGQPATVHITVANGRVTVADHGPGVADELADEVLDRFRSTGSSGLGLSIVRWVAQAHGGRLDVYNADEGGAIFELTLPLAEPAR